MDFNDATRDIGTKYPTLSTSDIRNMMDDEIRAEEANLSKERGTRDKYQKAVNTAHGRILGWIATANEYQIDDIASFIASHRRACVWAVLVGQKLHEEQHRGHAHCLACGECATCNLRPCRDGFEHQPEAPGATRMTTQKFKIGDKFKLAPDALDNYHVSSGPYTVSAIYSHYCKPADMERDPTGHPRFDAAGGSPLYGSIELPFDVYEWEMEAA